MQLASVPSMRALVAVVLSAFVLLAPALAFACPDCLIGQLARAEVFAQGFARNLAMALLPFAFVAAIAVFAEQIGRAR